MLDIGHGVTSIVSMFETVTSAKVFEFGGYDLTQSVMKEYEIASYLHGSRIKEKLWSVPYESSDVLFADQERSIYALPDGQKIKIGKERMMKPLHCFFDEGGYGGINVSELVTKCVVAENKDPNVRDVLWKNIILAGGTSAMNGFAERFAKEIKGRTRSKTQVIAGSSRKFLSWIGGVVISSLSTFRKMTISKQAYEEKGDRVLRETK